LPARGGIWSSRTQSTQVPESHLVPLVEFLYCQPNPKFFFNYRDGKFGVFGLNNTPNNERPNDGLASRNHLWSFIVHGNALLKQKALQWLGGRCGIDCSGAEVLAAFKPYWSVLIFAVAHFERGQRSGPCAVRRLSH